MLRDWVRGSGVEDYAVSVYIAVVIVWLWLADKQTPCRWDLAGTALCLLGMMVILLAPRG